MSQILYKKDLLEMLNKQSFEGYVLIQSYGEQPTKTGSSFMGGNLEANGTVSFKAWRGTAFDTLKESELEGKICLIGGEINDWNGTKSVIINSISEVPESVLEKVDLKKSDFFEPKYNIDSYWDTLNKIMEKHTSKEGYEIFSLIMSEVEESFKEEFAAINYHDNCKGGLLAHTTKVVKLASVISLYPDILKRISEDLLYVGAGIHDIGKVIEYSTGVISEKGKHISHLTIGCLMLEEHKDRIIELKGEDFYYSLLSIIAQHHGSYEETPRTIAAYVVHQIDCLESTLALLNQTLEEIPEGSQISFDSMKLV